MGRVRLSKILLTLFCLVFPLFPLHAEVIVLQGIILESEADYERAGIDLLTMEEAPLLLRASALSTSLAATCSVAEYGDKKPFHTTTILLDEDYYVLGGHAKWIPSSPGEAGESTIAGIDSDNDCVRDDIERYIARKFRKQGDKRKRKYLFEYAKYLGQFLVPSLSRSAAQSISANIYIAAECVYRIHGNNDQTTKLIKNTFSKFHNTYPRSNRYNQNNELLGGWTTRENINVSCP